MKIVMKGSGGATVRFVNKQKFVWKISERGRDSSTSARRVGERWRERGSERWRNRVSGRAGEGGRERESGRMRGFMYAHSQNLSLPRSLAPSLTRSPVHSLGA